MAFQNVCKKQKLNLNIEKFTQQQNTAPVQNPAVPPVSKETESIPDGERNYNLFDEDIPFPKLKIRSMKTRWGVCNKRDNSVTLNSKLIKYSIHEIDYVIIHELSHFVHFDHSREFWETVQYYMSDYKKAVAVLKE